MPRARQMIHEEPEECESDDARRQHAMLQTLFSLYCWRTVKAEQVWLKQKAMMAQMARQLDTMQSKAQEVARHNCAAFSAMSAQNRQRTLSLFEMKKWREKEQQMAQSLQEMLAQCHAQEKHYARQCDEVDRSYQQVHRQRKRQEKFRFILENSDAL